MCQMRIVEEKDGIEKLLLENVTQLEITPNGIDVNTLFEGSTTIQSSIARIDFNAGKIFLKPSN